MNSVSTNITRKLIRVFFNIINKIPFYTIRTLLMSILITLLGYVRLKYNVYEKEHFKKYNCYDKVADEPTNKSKYYWIDLPSTENQYVHPYLKFYPNFNPPNHQCYPPIEKVVSLFKSDSTELQQHPKNINVLFASFANVWVNTFFHTTFDDNLVPLNRYDHLIPSPIYGFTKGHSDIIRTFEGGKIKLRSDNTPIRLSDISFVERKGLNLLNPFDKDIFIGGYDRSNSFVGYYVILTICQRNHNVLCDKIREIDHRLDDTQIFNLAKTINTYYFIKLVLGPYISAISGASDIRSDYVTSLYFTKERLSVTWEYNVIYQWHGLLPESIDNRKLSQDAYNPEVFYSKNIGEWLQILSNTKCNNHILCNTQEFLLPIEKKMIESCRAANLLSYCDYRRRLKMPVPKTFNELTGNNKGLSEKLEEIYETVENVEFAVGIRAEPLSNMFGETIQKTLAIIALNSVPCILSDYKEYIQTFDKSEELLKLIDNFDYLNQYIKGVLSDEELHSFGQDISFFTK